MTAAELYEIVKDVPKEAWPVNFNYARHHRDLAWGHTGYIATLEPEQAELIFVGSMTHHLIGEGFHDFEWDTGDEVVLPSLTLYDHGPFFGSRPVEALAAACKAVVGKA